MEIGYTEINDRKDSVEISEFVANELKRLIDTKNALGSSKGEDDIPADFRKALKELGIDGKFVVLSYNIVQSLSTHSSMQYDDFGFMGYAALLNEDPRNVGEILSESHSGFVSELATKDYSPLHTTGIVQITNKGVFSKIKVAEMGYVSESADKLGFVVPFGEYYTNQMEKSTSAPPDETLDSNYSDAELSDEDMSQLSEIVSGQALSVIKYTEGPEKLRRVAGLWEAPDGHAILNLGTCKTMEERLIMTTFMKSMEDFNNTGWDVNGSANGTGFLGIVNGNNTYKPLKDLRQVDVTSKYVVMSWDWD